MQPANSTVSSFDQSHEWQNFRKRDDCNKQATTLKRSFSSDHTGPVSVYERGAAWLERKHQRQLVMREEAVRRQDKECTFQPCFHSCHDGRDRLPFTQERARLFFERNVSWRMHLDEIQQHQREVNLKSLEDHVRRRASQLRQVFFPQAEGHQQPAANPIRHLLAFIRGVASGKEPEMRGLSSTKVAQA